MIYSLLISLLLTLIIESIVAFFVGIRKEDDFKTVIIANVITNPIVVFIANLCALANNIWLYFFVVLIMEIWAVLIEAFIFKKHLKYKEKPALAISIINNGLSFAFGIIISLL